MLSRISQYHLCPLNTIRSFPASPTPSQSDIKPPAEDVFEDPSDHKPPDRQTSTGDDSQDHEVCPRLQESIARMV